MCADTVLLHMYYYVTMAHTSSFVAWLQGHTPLHVACTTRRVDLVLLLLQHGADPNATDMVRQQHTLCRL